MSKILLRLVCLIWMFVVHPVLATPATRYLNTNNNKSNYHNKNSKNKKFSSQIIVNKDVNNNKKNLRNKNVYICLSGQLSRLELQNKIVNVMTPLHRIGFGMYVSLVLTTGRARYVNNDNGDKMSLFNSIAQVEETLMNVNGVIAVKYFPGIDRIKKMPYLNKNYEKVLTSKPNIKKSERNELNARQYRMLQFCSYWPEAISNTSLFLRMREDIFITSIQLRPIIRMARLESKIVTSDCDTYRGINDRMAFGPASAAVEYFTAPNRYYRRFNRTNVKRYNTEQLHKDSLEAYGMVIQATDRFFITKAVTKISNATIPAGYTSEDKGEQQVCTVETNPFQLDSPGNELCPKSLPIDKYYRAVCHH